jgi:ABC-type glycerol-3-phosphate transport system permease component
MFNPSPRLVTGVVAALVLVAIVLTFAVIFQRSPAYATVVDAPILHARAPRDDARDTFRQEEASARNNESRARSADARALAAQDDVTAFAAIVEQAQSSEDLAGLLQAEINARQGIDEDNLVLVTLLAAQAALEGGDEPAALQALSDGTALVEAEAVDRAETAASRREGAAEAQADLEASRQALADAQATLDAALNSGATIRTNALLQMIPYYLVAWAAALALAAAVWGILYALRSRIEDPRTVINLLLWTVMAAIVVGVGTAALQSRLSGNLPPTQTLRSTLLGMMFALASGGLPFAIWNLKGYFDTIPKDLEQAALIDGAGRIETFFRIMLPLSMPAFAITILFSFMGSWTEYLLSWLFLTGEVQNYTLAMALASMAGGTNQPPPDMQQFAALAILVSLPILILFFAAQRWIVSGLTIGAVK